MDKLYVFRTSHLLQTMVLRSGSLCMATHLHHQTCLGYSDRDVYPIAIDWDIELVLIGNVPDQDSVVDYPEIGGSTYREPAEEDRLIIMVVPTGGHSQNNSSRYPTIRRSEAFDAWTPNDGMI
jgi:hypothetical protein